MRAPPERPRPELREAGFSAAFSIIAGKGLPVWEAGSLYDDANILVATPAEMKSKSEEWAQEILRRLENGSLLT